MAALALALTRDAEPSVRREAALALGKVIDERTAVDVRQIGMDALARASTSDTNLEVCVTADHVLAGLPRRTPPRGALAR